MKCFGCDVNHDRWMVRRRRVGKAGEWRDVRCLRCGYNTTVLESNVPAVLVAAQALESSVRETNGAGPKPAPLNTDLET